MLRSLPASLCFMLCLQASAQSAKPADPPVTLPQGVELKATSPRLSLHAPRRERALQPGERNRNNTRIYDNLAAVELKIIVNENGRVESANPTGGPAEFYEQARQIELGRTFEPVRIHGVITRVQADDGVSILPPEEWGKHVEWPSPGTIQHASITLQRTSCFGSCPAYTVTIDDAGRITWESDDPRAIGNHHLAHTSTESFRKLLDQFRTANFLSALPVYECGWTDMPTQTLTLTINGTAHSVKDYGGSIVGMPDAVKALEDAVDETSSPDRWLGWTPQTLPSLTAEHWNFGADSVDNLHAYNSALLLKTEDALRMFEAAHAPVVSRDPGVPSPICVASLASDLDRVRRMATTLPVSKPFPQPVLQYCLTAAAAAGKLPIVEFWIEHGATTAGIPRPKGYFEGYYSTPLLGAIASRQPGVVARILALDPLLTPAANDGAVLLTYALQEHQSAHSDDQEEAVAAILTLLLQKGLDPNATDRYGNSPISEAASSPLALKVLLNAGARIDARDAHNLTALIRDAFMEAAVRNLLAAGADPTVVGADGSTALSRATQYNCQPCVGLLQKALAAAPATGPVK